MIQHLSSLIEYLRDPFIATSAVGSVTGLIKASLPTNALWFSSPVVKIQSIIITDTRV